MQFAVGCLSELGAKTRFPVLYCLDWKAFHTFCTATTAFTHCSLLRYLFYWLTNERLHQVLCSDAPTVPQKRPPVKHLNILSPATYLCNAHTLIQGYMKLDVFAEDF